MTAAIVGRARRSPIRLVETPTELAQLGALTSDLLTQQASSAEHAPQDETSLNDGPNPPLADIIDPEAREGEKTGEHTDDKDRRAEHSEKEKRLLPESELEPH